MATSIDMSSIFGPDGLLARALPNYEERSQQVVMSQHVWEILRTQKTLLVEAGTGTGKTLAYLVPALLSGKVNGKREFLAPHRPNFNILKSAHSAGFLPLVARSGEVQS